MKVRLRRYYLCFFLFTVLLLKMPAMGLETEFIFLPADYESQQERRYPVLYVISETSDEGIQQDCVDEILRVTGSDEAMDMIVVCIAWDTNEDPDRERLFAAAQKIVEETDGHYRTVADPAYRGIAGFKEGGYLAGLLAWTDAGGALLPAPSLFGMTASIAGIYTGEMADRYGSYAQMLREGELSNAKAQQFYTFMRTAAKSLSAYEEGGANEVISLLIEKGAAYGGFYYQYYGNADKTVLDLQITDGEEDESFFLQACHDMITGMSEKMIRDLLAGKLDLSSRVITSETDYVEASAQIELSPECSLFGINDDTFASQIPVSYILTPQGEAPEAGAEDIALQAAGTKDAGTGIQDTDPEDSQADTQAQATDRQVSAVSEKEACFYGSGNASVRLDAAYFYADEMKVSLQADLLGMRTVLDSKSVIRTKTGGVPPEERFVDLTGAWYFSPCAYIKKGELPKPEEYTAWEQVIPCLGWWDEDFSENTDMKAYTGYAWYIREFTLPESYAGSADQWLLPLGCMDETDLCFINGEMVGSTGFDPERWTPQHDSWDTNRLYEVRENLLHFGETNVIMVLINNASGDGGWYSGRPGIYTPGAYEAAGFAGAGNEERYEDVTLDDGTHFLVYLPETYTAPESADRRYQTVYLLHQINSTSRSYVLDGIDEILDEAIAAGRLQEVIVVIPDSTPQSWWINGWEGVVAETIVPYVDAAYRTIHDREHRILAGASMGGHGAYHIALKYPEVFAGIISFYGAINMASNPLAQMTQMDAESLARFRHYFICGNRDLYKFGIPAIALDRLLSEDGIDHFFALGEGGHDSAFYLPHLVEALAYMERH